MREYTGENSLAALSTIIKAELGKKAEGVTVTPITRSEYNSLSAADKQDPKKAWAIFDDPPGGGSGVASFNGRTGDVLPAAGDYTAADVGAVPTTRKVNGKALSADISLTAEDVGARPSDWNPDLSSYAPKDNPVFTGSISMVRWPNSTIGDYSVAVGQSTMASGQASHAEGGGTKATGHYSHSEGTTTTASGYRAHAEGNETIASGHCSHAGGYGCIAAGEHQTAIGAYNIESDQKTDKLIIGNGINSTIPANCFRVTETGTYASGNYNASGADYAELFEWLDGNPEQEDRCGRFVTLDGEKIRLAGPDDSFILGVVSGNPSVVGDVYDDQWQGMYLFDVFGRPIWEDVEVPDELGPDGQVLIPAHTEHRQALNPAYDSEQKYVPRTQRPEWDAVGMLGKLVALDDGTCRVNGWANVGDGGLAVHSARATRYRVMARLDETHIRLLIL